MNVPIPTYTVTLKITQKDDSPLAQRTGTIDVPTFLGKVVAGRRAKWSAIVHGWGTRDEVQVQSVDVAAA